MGRPLRSHRSSVCGSCACESWLRGWSPFAWVLLVVCLAGSGAAALIVRDAAVRDASRAFDLSAAKAASSVTISLRRADDVAVSLAATAGTHRGTMTERELTRWNAQVSAGGRYPGLLGFTYIRNVPAAGLQRFGDELRAAGAPVAPRRGALDVFPPGRRASYCLVKLSAAPALTTTALRVPAGALLDVCAAGGGEVLAAARDSGRLSAIVLTLAPQGRVLNLSVPVYGGVTAPSTVSQRRARITGWVLAQFSVASVFGSALSGNHDLTLTVARRDLVETSSSRTVFGPISSVASVGRTPTGALLSRAFTVRADGLWILNVTGGPESSGVGPATQAFVVFGAGVLIALLVFTVVVLLARRRVQSEEQLRAILKNSPAPVFIRDRKSRYLLTNDAFDRLFGTTARSAIGRPVDDVLSGDALETALGSEPRVLAGETVLDEMAVELRGSERALQTLKFPLIDGAGRAYAVCGIINDVTERRRLETQLRFLAEHDPLTGVENRQRLIEELDRQLRYAARYHRPGAVLTFDVDHLTAVNDTYGHATGDTMLRALAGLLRDRTRDTDIVARLGGDEFTVVLPEGTPEHAIGLADDIRSRLTDQHLEPSITLSAGVATFTGNDELTADELLVCADIALYEAKERGGNQVRLYTGQTSGSLTWVQRIRQALSEDRFVLYGQPIVDLRSGAISHYELLIRMLSEQDETIPPGAFLPTAERFGLITEIDRWVTRAGLRLAGGLPGVAINLSAYSIGDEAIIAALNDALADGLDPAKVIFEITETAAMRNMRAARQFAETLDRIGCGVALDDFGTGFGSFTYLSQLRVRHLKIDTEFVRDLTRGEAEQQVVRPIIELAHMLNKLTIAEGVEDAETLAILKAIGADFAQGFHLGRPTLLTAKKSATRSEQRARSRGNAAGARASAAHP